MKEQPCWVDTAPAWAAERQEVPARVDVVVIGAGYGGLSAARAVARGGASVAVFERQALGDGASGRNGGQVLTRLNPGAGDLVARYGRARARVLFAASLEAISMFERVIADEAIACDCERVGHLEAAAKASHFEHFKAEQEVLGREFDHRVDLVPRSLQDTELGAAGYHGVLVDPGSLAIHPVKYLHGLARAALAAGVRLYDRTPVTRVTRAGVGFEVTAAGRKIVARDVIACTGGYTDAALPGLRRRVVPIGSYVIATEPLSPDLAATIIPRRRVVFDSKYFLSHFRLSPDNRLVFGGLAQFTPSTPASTRASAVILRRRMLDVFPQLGDVRVEYAWSGNVDFTRDRLPHAGLVDAVHYAIGYGGHGIALSTYLGTRVGECLLGRQADTPFHDLRFDPIPLYRGRPWFLPFAGLYYKWKDFIQ
jgi:glycine/D-amino acid oxidase-like deaminating enzyme